jgi:hypothetical protein
MNEVKENTGVWLFRSFYIGFRDKSAMGTFRDATISSLKTAPRTARTFELNLVLRGNKQRSGGIIPSP